MTLEDFFTSVELKHGLTTPTRVHELLTVMQNEKENIGKNVSDGSHGTRQWSAIATAIAATENKECLDLFVQLDGLSFIAKWLKDAQNVVDDSGNGGFDELIVALLRGLERLQVDHDLSVGSGIGLTVQGLVGHSSLVVREKAKELCERWAPVQDVDGAPADVISASISPGGNNNNNNVENVEQSVCSDTVQQETDKDEMPTQEIIMVENDKSKSESESTLLTGISSTLEDVKEKPENNCTSSSPAEHKTLTSDIDVDHGLESATKTETMEDVIDKDEEMVDLDHGDTVTELETTSRIGDSAGGGGLQDSPDADNHPKMTSDTESDEADEDDKKDVGTESGDDSASHSRLKKRGDDFINKRPSDMELDYGMVDPLELARQVANEVELEVDSPEQSCSSTTSEPEPGPSSKGSPSPAEPEHPATQINETGQESGLNPEKGFSGFDLNQEVSSHEIETENERLVDQIVTPVSVVSASRAAAADGLPVAPLQFEGTLGWKGSAATSAFRRIPESEKTYSSSSSHNNSNQRLNHLDFDLNVAEDSDDKIDKTQDFLSRDKVEESSKLQLDLNSFGDGDAGVISLDWKHDGRVRQNGAHKMDLNLNDHLTIQNNASFNNTLFGKPFNNKRDESVFSIFGTQVEVNHNEYIPHPTFPPSNGRIPEPSVDFSLGRPGSGSGFGVGSSMPYANLPAYGYGHNGYTMGPMYAPPGGPIPYMVQPTFPQPTQPFFFNMAATGAPSGSNGAGPSRNSLDLNPGFITEMGNREMNNNNMGLRQFFNHNQASSSSVTGGKREEPDSGWELFPMNYKHQQPPWQ
ncbi:putative transcription regulator IWS1 family [Helianthus annuus]|uniref:Putative transcription factor IIS n=1 Tax=Helianthus annuus TaxID=4232 RepID=A0A251SF27_HELAN|nr:uncharacterized protein LOC110908246 [Helianthus annuus]XP_022008856.1 uncharacterized protein LOC110908246 [Helianthus annuus]KAF5767453.1 putative transcription regulator IWS1 family [Helianthus annuus]